MALEPVRRIRPSSRSITGKRPSQKTQIIQRFESTLERDFLTLLEFDTTIEDYGVQPITIPYVHEGKARRYTPDALIYYKPNVGKKPLLCEIKYAEELQQKKDLLEPKFNAATAYANANGFQFKVFTEVDIRNCYLRNIKFLSRYYHDLIDESYSKMVAAALLKKTTATPQELLTGSTEAENANILYTVWQMLARKIISCDMHQPISMTSTLCSSPTK